MSTEVTTNETSVSWREAVLRLFSRDSNAGTQSSAARAGMFDGASHIRVQNSHFTINNYGDIVPHNAAPASEEGQRTSAHVEDEPPAPPQQRSLSTARTAQDVYVDSLLPKGKGFPLWIPALSLGLPLPNVKRGVTLGDVGVITPDGGFDFVFNIFQDVASNDINAPFGLPEGFSYFQPPLGSIFEHVDLSAGSHLADASIVQADGGSNGRTSTFVSTEPEAALLTLPEDATSYSLRITPLLRRYVQQNTVAWYKFCKITLGRDIRNGDLRVVSACRKSSGYGIATAFRQMNQPPTTLTFTVNETLPTDNFECPYSWHHTGSAQSKVGPSQEERRRLRYSETVANQCLFISTIDAWVSAKEWESLEVLAYETTIADQSLPLGNDPGSAPHATEQNAQQGFEISEKGRRHRADSTDTAGTTRICHPSAIIHSILEAMYPGFPVYIVTHHDWEPILREKNMTAHSFVERVLRTKVLVEHQDFVYFRNRIPPIFEERDVVTVTFGKVDSVSGLWEGVRDEAPAAPIWNQRKAGQRHPLLSPQMVQPPATSTRTPKATRSFSFRPPIG